MASTHYTSYGKKSVHSDYWTKKYPGFIISRHDLIDTICVFSSIFFFENLTKNRKTYQLGAYQLGHEYCMSFYTIWSEELCRSRSLNAHSH